MAGLPAKNSPYGVLGMGLESTHSIWKTYGKYWGVKDLKICIFITTFCSGHLLELQKFIVSSSFIIKDCDICFLRLQKFIVFAFSDNKSVLVSCSVIEFE